MLNTEIHYKGYIAKTCGESFLIIIDEKTGKECMHTHSYTGEGTVTDLIVILENYINSKPKLKELINNEEDGKEEF